MINKPKIGIIESKKLFFEIGLVVIRAHILFLMKKRWTGKWQNNFVDKNVDDMKLK